MPRTGHAARTLACGIGLAALWLGPPAPAAAETLRVGSGEPFATPCAAIAAASGGDVIEIAAATYTDSCAIDVPDVTLRGVGGQPTIDLSDTDHPAQYKGIYVVTADGVTIENLELTGAHISADNGENAAAIRIEAADLTVRGCFIHDNQNGILGGTSGTLTVEHSEFFRNGMGDGCNGGGCTHNLYVANIDALYFRFNWSHGIATDTADKGHLLKSRARANYIEYNRITGEDGADSYEVELPNGGLARIVGNVIQKGAASGNSTLLSWGAEGASNPDDAVFIVNNTFVNDSDGGTFIDADGATLLIRNNLFVGPGTPSSAGAVSPDNLSGIDPRFVDRAHFDYHLQDDSPAIGKAVDALMAGAATLAPEFEYVHPLGSAERTMAEDVGAFEHGTRATPRDAGVTRDDAGLHGGVDAGGAAAGRGGAGGGSKPVGSGGEGGMAGAAGGGGGSASAGHGAGGDAGAEGAADGGDATAAQRDASGCGCSVPGTRGRGTFGAWLALAALLMARGHGRGRASLLALVLACTAPACTDSAEATHDAGAGGSAGDSGSGATGAGGAGAGTGGGGTPPRDASTSTGVLAETCPELGWCELPDTLLESVCPDAAQYPEIQANEGCGGVINDWGGGIADTARNRLLIWGGGHRGYFGNEVYALDLRALAMRRLNDPSDIAGVDLDECASPEAYADGRPSSRHTYDGLAYDPLADVMFSVGGAGIPCGYAVTGTWILDLARVASTPLGGAAPWTNPDPDPYPTKATYGVVSDYDPRGKRILVDDTYNLWSYDVATNTYAKLNDSDQTGAHIDYHMTGRVDPERQLFVIVGGGEADGGGMQVFDIGQGSDHAQQNWTNDVEGCEALMAASSPGLAYDPIQDRMIGWAGGDSVITLDLDAKRCTATPYPDGPGDANPNGTFGRFRYFPSAGVFAVVNEYRRNAFALRLTR